MVGCFQDDEAIGADVGSIRLKFLEVHNDYIKKTQEYDAMYGEHARISQVIMISVVTSVQTRRQINKHTCSYRLNCYI